MSQPLCRRVAVLALASLFLVAAPTPAAAQESEPTNDIERRPREIERRTSEVVRRIVSFDGQARREVGDEVTVTLDGDVLFEFDRADLTPEAEATLVALAEELAERATGEATIVGHTDSIGDDAYNLDLSLRRARTVEAFLEPRVDGAVSFTVDGRGEAEPVADNQRPDGSDDPDGRRRNRRVEVTFTAVES